MPDKMQKMVDSAKHVVMTEDEKEAQRRSFAYGNANLENDRVTHEVVAQAAKALDKNG